MAASLTVGSPDGGAAPTSPLRVAAALYTLFVVYGCLIPLDFTPVPWTEAWAIYRHIPEFRPGPSSRTDFTANVLLFLPLAFLWAGSIGAGWRRLGAISKSVLVWTAAVLFQAALEFAQVYAPPRSVSLWDVLAATCGAAIGVAAWSAAGGAVGRALERWSAACGRQGVAGWLVAPYSIFLIVYSVIPVDLTLKAASLYRKWDRGLIRPIPFTSLGDDPVAAALGLAAEALLWLPLAALLLLGGRARGFTAWGLTVLFAVGIEALQLLVLSRVSDSTHVLCAAAGAGAGVFLGLRLRRGTAVEDESLVEIPPLLLASLLAAVAWAVLLIVGSCYPFDFSFEPSEISARTGALTALPFHTIWPATGARHSHDLLTQLALFVPFGMLAALAITSVRGPWASRVGAFAACLVAATVAGGIEMLQVFLPDRVSASTDIVAAAIGGGGGFAAVRAIWRAVRRGRVSVGRG
ncbi:MAG: VanZ family protein [Candidatus Eisenbacteria bacterium]